MTVALANPTNKAPPTGAILDLGGLSNRSIPHDTPEVYSVDFTAVLSKSAITFAFRNDPWFLQFSDVSLVDVTTGSGSLLSNGDFSAGTYFSASSLHFGTPDDWTYSNIDGAAFGGYVRSNCVGATSCWYDGAIQGYDELSQSVMTTVGDQYQISFSVLDTGGPSLWSGISTNGDVTDSGGNGADILAYVGGITGPSITDYSQPKTIPEPSTWVMMLLGFATVGYFGYRRGSSLVS